MSKFKCSNIPIPKGHLITLVAGVALNLWHPLELWEAIWQRQVLGWILLLIGILLALWATVTFKQMDFETQTEAVTTGPYAFSRNPTCVAWHVIYLSIALAVNTLWLVALLPVLIVHFSYIRSEERQLDENFGEAYRARVRRYL